MSECLFCRIAARQIPSKSVFENDRVFAFRDIAPKAPTHILVIPKEHLATVNDFTPAHQGLIAELILTAQRIANEEGIADRGYRLVFNCNAEAGQTVWHIHLHLLGGRGMQWPPG